MHLLVVNAGSSTVKLSVLDGKDLVTARTIEAPGGEVDQAQLARLADEHGPFDAVGHRVVHGGTEFTRPVLLDEDVVDRLRGLTPLAPLHQPGSLAGIAALSKLLPDVPAVACFDTAFHATIPEEAFTYAVPEAWRQRWGVRRYGFHGLSHSYASRRAAEMVAGAGSDGGSTVPARRRVITCHLGAGASLAAVRDGACLDTTMGFTPLEGLVMATRSGTVDPGLVLWLAQHGGLSPDEISHSLEHASGLLALAGSGDMRQVLAAESEGVAQAKLALGVYVHRLAALVASMAASLGGVDVLVFTGGVGENAHPVRQRAADSLGWLGVAIDGPANQAAHPDCEVTASGAAVRTLVVAAREDLEIARGVEGALHAGTVGSPG